jgi:hypothetical protein
MPEMSDDGVLEYIVQEVEETGIGPNVTIIIGGLVAGSTERPRLYYDNLSSIFDIVSSTSCFVEAKTCDINRRLKGKKVARISELRMFLVSSIRLVCDDCEKEGSDCVDWMLFCMACGHVACDDSSRYACKGSCT